MKTVNKTVNRKVRFNKVDMHTMTRIINVNPLITCKFILSMAETESGSEYLSRFQFYNFETGKQHEIRGGRKQALVEVLNTLLKQRKTGDDVTSYMFNAVKGFSKVTSVGVATNTDDFILVRENLNRKKCTELLENLLNTLNHFMSIRTGWVSKGLFNESTKDGFATGIRPDFFIKIIEDTVSSPVGVVLDMRDNKHIFTIWGKESQLVIHDDTEMKEGQKSLALQAIEKISKTLRHILNYDQKEHRITLFSDIDASVHPSLVSMNGYVSLLDTGKYRRLTINFDQIIKYSKVHWRHSLPFTRNVLQAIEEVLERY